MAVPTAMPRAAVASLTGCAMTFVAIASVALSIQKSLLVYFSTVLSTNSPTFVFSFENNDSA